ncbi:MAG: ABC transporter ATP-binding protein [Pseudomonadota bacterium]
MSDQGIQLEAIAVAKHFGDVKALVDISLKLRKGSVHALLGENGAGKSTLVKCIMGYYKPDSGQLIYNDKQVVIDSPQQASALGIGMVYQHFTLIPNMTIAENIVLSRPNLPMIIKWADEIKILQQKMQQMPFQFDLNRKVSSLSAGEKQKVEITKQLLLDTQVLILDEPTSVLTPTEADEVLDKIYQLTRTGKLSVLIITHKFREVTKYADEVTVLRKGLFVGTAKVTDVTPATLADMMVGGELIGTPPARQQHENEIVKLIVEDLVVDNDQGAAAVNALSLSVNAGEIVGIAGVSGNGQKQLVEALAGQRVPRSGKITAQGKLFTGTQEQIHQQGFYCLPEEPLRNACVGKLSVAENLVLRKYNRSPFCSFKFFLNRRAIKANAEQLIAQYKVRTSGPDQEIQSLSGGNIQRVVLARELAQPVSILVVANPCFGLDFKAVADIRAQIIAARNKGTAVLLLSEDLDEILELSDRMFVISGGKLVHQTTPEKADLNTIGQYMAGH